MAFLHLDADDVGARLELLLLDGEIERAGVFSNQLRTAFQQIRDELESIPSAEVLLFGGDEVIVSLPNSAISQRTIEKLTSNFSRSTGIGISGGIGGTIQAALENLRRAKLSGKNQIIGSLNES